MMSEAKRRRGEEATPGGNEQLAYIVNHYPQLKSFNDEHAMITDEYMDSLGITGYTTNTPYIRDNRSLENVDL